MTDTDESSRTVKKMKWILDILLPSDFEKYFIGKPTKISVNHLYQPVFIEWIKMGDKVNHSEQQLKFQREKVVTVYSSFVTFVCKYQTNINSAEIIAKNIVHLSILRSCMEKDKENKKFLESYFKTMYKSFQQDRDVPLNIIAPSAKTAAQMKRHFNQLFSRIGNENQDKPPSQLMELFPVKRRSYHPQNKKKKNSKKNEPEQQQPPPPPPAQQPTETPAITNQTSNSPNQTANKTESTKSIPATSEKLDDQSVPEGTTTNNNNNNKQEITETESKNLLSETSKVSLAAKRKKGTGITLKKTVGLDGHGVQFWMKVNTNEISHLQTLSQMLELFQ
jgi:hypothetical protein